LCVFGGTDYYCLRARCFDDLFELVEKYPWRDLLIMPNMTFSVAVAKFMIHLKPDDASNDNVRYVEVVYHFTFYHVDRCSFHVVLVPFFSMLIQSMPEIPEANEALTNALAMFPTFLPSLAKAVRAISATIFIYLFIYLF
jgi:hypothetical protein